MSLQRRASELQPARRAVELSSLAQVRAEGGRQIPLRVRAPLESMLGHDFSSVRIHTGPLARRVARGLGAEAFTSRNDVVFARDRYRPDTPEGLNLLAHELVHTIQQRASRPMSNALPVARAPTHAQARMAPPSVEEQPGEEVCSPWAAVLCEQVDLTTVARDVQLEALRELAREIDRVEAELRESEGWSGDGAATSKLAQSAMKGLRDKATAVVAAGPEKPTPYKPPDKGASSARSASRCSSGP
nr:DUF4157 domain-containing protein [Nannocystis pusilla]